VEYFHKRMEALDINYANHLYEVKGFLNDQQQYKLSTASLGKEKRFTTDGSKPTATSAIYKQAIPFTKNLSINAGVFKEGKLLGKVFKQQLLYHKGVGATITINKEPNKSYPGSGAQGLINGIKGSDSRYGDSEWLGFWGDDIEIEITFKEPTEINTIDLRFYHGPGQWIYTPKEFELFFTLELGDTVYDRREIKESENNIIEINYKLYKPKSITPKYNKLKITIPNYGIIREGKQGAGNKAWTFIDEIIIN
jgi:hexosaminidase